MSDMTFLKDYVKCTANGKTVCGTGKQCILERLVLTNSGGGSGLAVSIIDGDGLVGAVTIPIAPSGNNVEVSHTVEIGAKSKIGPWTVQLGANVSAIAIGRFI